MNISVRIKTLIKSVYVTEGAFCEKYGISRFSWRNEKNGSIKIETVEFLLKDNPDLSAEWLLRGKGEMLLSNIGPMSGSEQIKESDEIIIEQSREIHRLKRENERLKNGKKEDAV